MDILNMLFTFEFCIGQGLVVAEDSAGDWQRLKTNTFVFQFDLIINIESKDTTPNSVQFQI